MKWGIRKKLILLLTLATILPFGAGIIITYHLTIESINKRSLSYNHDLIEKGKEELVSYLDDVSQMSTVLYRYTPFMNVLAKGISANLIDNQEEVSRVLAYLFNTRPEIEQMHLYIEKGKDSYTNYHSSISGRTKNANVYSHSYYKKYLMGEKGYSLIEPPHTIYSYNNQSFIPNSQKQNVLSFHNIIRDIPSDEFLGFLSIDINLSKIDGIANRLYTKNEEEFYIMDEKGVIIYSSDEHEEGKQNKEKWYKQVKKMNNQKSLEWKDDNFSGVLIFDQFPVQHKNWSIVKKVPYDVIYKSARSTALNNIAIGFVSLVIVLITTMIISFKITAPIKVLIDNMKKVEKGEFKADFDSLGNDEIGKLGEHFKLMIAKINELIDREYKLEIENKASQLRVLRSQINPHFLYNSLQSIGTLALKSKATQVYSLLTALSSIMRYSMNMKEDIVPLTAEIKHVKSYLLLQKQRFDDQFNFDISIDKEGTELFIPKMILQPIVENTFKHGFLEHKADSYIYIEVLVKDQQIICTVKDNGNGINEQELKIIRQELETGSSAKKGRESIGLKNIHDRLAIYYKNQAEMTIESIENEGFTVRICMPKDVPGEVEEE
ncbi:sensor histidine kinase [Niallia sp. NCCP-28]|uniref:sensor histidine kinase n=1 Tax=Niallia sp. NCCP-28 TaxID=2934712 RepID=UPI002082841E|nr:sensor histidine kinase [Niallia sp. NCCP-28]GKU84481.1 histidine kinase [Niallia sp. NCCP-28]